MPQYSRGLKAVRHISGDERTREVAGGIASGYAQNIFKGDPLKKLADGTYGVSDGTVVDAISLGVEYVDATGRKTVEKTWRAGTVATEIKLFVTDDVSGLECEIETDAAAPANIVGKSCNLAVGVGDHLNGSSACRLNVASAATPGTAVKVRGFSKRVGNVPGAVAILVVEIL